jgi:hypothetical protein
VAAYWQNHPVSADRPLPADHEEAHP